MRNTLWNRPAAGFPGYRVGIDGTIWSCWERGGTSPRPMTGVWRQLKPFTMGRGYWGVTLVRDGQRFKRTLHRLVAETWIGPRPPGQQIRHLDGDKSHNAVANLCYGTARENWLDTIRHRTAKIGVSRAWLASVGAAV